MKILPSVDPLKARARRLLADHRARAKRDCVTLDYSLSDVRTLLASSPTCEYCCLPLSFAVSLDHRQPIARGGRHQLGNLAVSCERCNRLKGMLTEGEFGELLTLLALLHPTARGDIERRLLAGGARYSTSRQRK